MTPQQLAAIRARDAIPQRDDELVTQEHATAAADRRALLEYIDELDRQITGIGETVSNILGASRLLLGMRLLEDGHAKTLGEAVRMAEDLDKVAGLYPWVEA